MTQEALAARAHLDTSTVNRLECGRSNCRLAVFVRVLRALDFLPHELFGKVAVRRRSRGRPPRQERTSA